MASGARTCVFRVSGTIELVTTLDIRNPYITIAGQTSPGGIQLSGRRKNYDGIINVFTHDVVIRYLKTRHGYNASCSSATCGANIAVYAGSNIVIDHNTVQWNKDEGISIWATSSSSPVGSNITISYNIMAEGLDPHSTASITGASSNAKADLMTNIDFYGNLIMNDSHRNPLLKNKSTKFVNNIIYNPSYKGNSFVGGIIVDVINNIFKRGPMTSASIYEIQGAAINGNSSNGDPSIYMSGNVGWHQPVSTGDQWLMAADSTSENGIQTFPLTMSRKRSTSYTFTGSHPITAIPTASVENTVLPIVGAGRRVTCDGSWQSVRDSQETKLIAQYTDNTGITAPPTSETQVGGFPSITGAASCADTDHDGMPDIWEVAHGFNPDSAADRNTVAANGYTNVENYLNGQ
jgi:pectate lyase